MVSSYLIFSIIGAVLYLALILYFMIGWLRLPRPMSNAAASALPTVSIIIPVRNESAHIQDCLRAVLAQDYPAHLFEVIVIDDYSTDPTIRLAKELANERVMVLDLARYFRDAAERVPNKKKAITIGVKNAKGTLIVTTDGDCVMGTGWLSALVRYYQQHSFQFITAPVLMTPVRNPLTLFQQLDVISMLGITGGTIALGYPTMCNGANLLYERAAFIAVDGYKGNTDIPTGDDIFLMQKLEQRYPDGIGFAKDMDACVYCRPEQTFIEFLSQRVRWTSKSTAFQKKSVTGILAFAYVYNLLILILIPIALQPVPLAWLPLAIAFGTKLLIDFVFNVAVTSFFRRTVMLLLVPLFEPLHIVYVVCIGVLGLSGHYTWKERKIG